MDSQSFAMLACVRPGSRTVVAKASHGLRSNRWWKGHLHLVVFIRQQSVPTFGGGPDTRHQRLLPCLWPTSGGYWKDADVLRFVQCKELRLCVGNFGVLTTSLRWGAGWRPPPIQSNQYTSRIWCIFEVFVACQRRGRAVHGIFYRLLRYLTCLMFLSFPVLSFIYNVLYQALMLQILHSFAHHPYAWNFPELSRCLAVMVACGLHAIFWTVE